MTAYSDEETLQRASSINFTSYLIKPFREDELITQLKLVNYYRTQVTHSSLELGKGYRYDYATQELSRDGLCIRLTAKEHQLFLALLNANGKVVTLSYIDDLIWPLRPISSGARRQLFYRLRGKLPGLELDSVNNLGYVLKI